MYAYPQKKTATHQTNPNHSRIKHRAHSQGTAPVSILHSLNPTGTRTLQPFFEENSETTSSVPITKASTATVGIQTESEAGKTEDNFEKEADQTADRVMALSESNSSQLSPTHELIQLIQQSSDSHVLQRGTVRRPYRDPDRWEKGCREWDELPRERDKAAEADRAKIVADYYVREILKEEPRDEGYGTNQRQGDCWVKHGNNPDGSGRYINVYLHPISKKGEVTVFLIGGKRCILEYSCPSGSYSIQFKIKECQ